MRVGLCRDGFKAIGNLQHRHALLNVLQKVLALHATSTHKVVNILLKRLKLGGHECGVEA
jgi:hypothetical protein